jgi:hypothetical protein
MVTLALTAIAYMIPPRAHCVPECLCLYGRPRQLYRKLRGLHVLRHASSIDYAQNAVAYSFPGQIDDPQKRNYSRAGVGHAR